MSANLPARRLEMAGRLIAIVGPSGVGKDTLIEGALAELPNLTQIRRVITRPEEAGGEDYQGVTEATFEAMSAAGEFAFEWKAHGLRYGIPVEIDAWLAAGQDLLFNGSRATLPALRDTYPKLEIILITAPPELLAERLASRGRESVAEIAARLARRVDPVPEGARIVVNSGSVADGVAGLISALSPEAESV